jgi:hypothetical protein
LGGVQWLKRDEHTKSDTSAQKMTRDEVEIPIKFGVCLGKMLEAGKKSNVRGRKSV